MRLSAVRYQHMTSTERRNLFLGLLFISPWIIGFLVFTIYPLIYSAYISLTRYDIIRPPVFIGFLNYKELFLDDPLFWLAVTNTLYYVFISVPLGLAFAFSLANMLNTRIFGRSFFRAILYIPAIVPAVATATPWLWPQPWCGCFF